MYHSSTLDHCKLGRKGLPAGDGTLGETLSQKKKQTGGNPANKAWKDGTALGDAVMGWCNDLIRVGSDDHATIAGAVAAWVGSGNPGRKGINQCVSACYQLQILLGAMGVTTVILPVFLRIIDPNTAKVLGTAGSNSPVWSSDFKRWTGHAVVFIPAQGRVLDVTIGQALTHEPMKQRAPLLGKVTGAVQGNVGAATAAGSIWQVQRNGHIAEYQVLKQAHNPLSQPRVVQALQAATLDFKNKAPGLARGISRLVSSRNQSS